MSKLKAQWQKLKGKKQQGKQATTYVDVQSDRERIYGEEGAYASIIDVQRIPVPKWTKGNLQLEDYADGREIDQARKSRSDLRPLPNIPKGQQELQGSRFSGAETDRAEDYDVEQHKTLFRYYIVNANDDIEPPPIPPRQTFQKTIKTKSSVNNIATQTEATAHITTRSEYKTRESICVTTEEDFVSAGGSMPYVHVAEAQRYSIQEEDHNYPKSVPQSSESLVDNIPHVADDSPSSNATTARSFNHDDIKQNENIPHREERLHPTAGLYHAGEHLSLEKRAIETKTQSGNTFEVEDHICLPPRMYSSEYTVDDGPNVPDDNPSSNAKTTQSFQRDDSEQNENASYQEQRLHETKNSVTYICMELTKTSGDCIWKTKETETKTTPGETSEEEDHYYSEPGPESSPFTLGNGPHIVDGNPSSNANQTRSLQCDDITRKAKSAHNDKALYKPTKLPKTSEDLKKETREIETKTPQGQSFEEEDHYYSEPGPGSSKDKDVPATSIQFNDEMMKLKAKKEQLLKTIALRKEIVELEKLNNEYEQKNRLDSNTYGVLQEYDQTYDISGDRPTNYIYRIPKYQSVFLPMPESLGEPDYEVVDHVDEL